MYGSAPANIGLTGADIVLGKHSGRHALRSHLAERATR